jgi:hypothetical protein
LAVFLVPVAVHADDGVDPHASSPAGKVYEIPLETARRDAAPHRKSSTRDSGGQTGQSGSSGSGGTGGGGGATGGGSPGGGASGGGGELPQGSAIKSENGFGSSSQVPGLSAAQAKASAGKAKAASAAAAGTGGTAAVQATRASDTAANPDDAPSTGGSYGLILLIVLGGAAAGLAAATAVRRVLGSAG